MLFNSEYVSISKTLTIPHPHAIANPDPNENFAPSPQHTHTQKPSSNGTTAFEDENLRCKYLQEYDCLYYAVNIQYVGLVLRKREGF